MQIKTHDAPAHSLKTLVNEKVKVATDTDWKLVTEVGLEAITQETLNQLLAATVHSLRPSISVTNVIIGHGCIRSFSL